MANAMHLYHPYSWIGRMIVRAVAFLPRRFTTRRLQHADELLLEQLAGAIQCMLGHDNLILSFSPGTPNAHRKITAQVSKDRRIIAYVKIGSSSAARKLMEAEALALSRLDPAAYSAVMSVPRVLARSTMDDYLLLALSAPPLPGRQRSLALDERDIRLLTSLVPLQPRIKPLEHVLDAIGFGDAHHASYPAFITSARKLVSSMLKHGVRMGPVHGDYVPWNTLELNDGSLYVFDWEHASEAPLLNDFFHRVFMPDRLVNGGIPARAAMARLFKLMDAPLTKPLLEKCRIDAGEFPAYLLLYLLQLVEREMREERGIDDYLRDCFQLVLSLPEYPAASVANRDAGLPP